jgi:hypothetical protein
MDHLKSLRIFRPHDIRKTLKGLPKDLNGTYDRILHRLDPLYAHEAMAALRWILFAARPLFIEEVAEASIIDLASSTAIDADKQMEPLDIAEILSGLVIIQPEPKDGEKFAPARHILTLAHFSVKEYLVSGRLSISGINLPLESNLAHCSMLESCMAYIRYCHIVSDTNGFKRETPLKSYACNRWTYHAARLKGLGSAEAIESVISVLESSDTAGYWIQNSRVYWDEGGEGYESAPFRISPYNELHTDLGLASRIDPVFSRFYPLYHATVFKLVDSVKRFLERCSNPVFMCLTRRS